VLAEFGPEVSGTQRYSYRNAAYWNRHGEPELNAPSRHRNSWSDPVDKAYAEALDAVGRSDTLWAVANQV